MSMVSMHVVLCGKHNENFPTDLRNVGLARGESVFRQCSSLMAVVWQDKRPVHVMSTLSQPGETAQVSRRERDGSRVEVSCPSAILTYTKYMGGVDLGDQLRKYYCVRLKCKKSKNMCFGPFSMYVSQMHLLLLSFVYHHLYARHKTKAD